MSIFDVRHQAVAQTILQRAISSERVPHAYIFHGPEGVGKEMLAVHFTKLLLCTNHRTPDNPPAEYAGLAVPWLDSCDNCEVCTLVDAGTHPDCHIVHRRLIKFHPDAGVRNRKALELGIDVIRHFVINAAGKKPAMGPAKVFLIRECEKLNQSAQNALLKTLEEPPPGTHLILLTTSPDKLLPTTRSRCQLVSFRPLPPSFVADQLAALRADVAEEQIHYFVHHEPGSLGHALQLVDDGFYHCNQALVHSLVNLKRTESLQLASQMEELGKEMGGVIQRRAKQSPQPEQAHHTASKPGRKDRVPQEAAPELTETDAIRQALRCLLAMIATLYRDVLNVKCGGQTTLCNLEARPALEKLAGRFDPARARRAIKVVADTEYQLNLNANTRLCLDNLAIQLARLNAN